MIHRDYINIYIRIILQYSISKKEKNTLGRFFSIFPPSTLLLKVSNVIFLIFYKSFLEKYRAKQEDLSRPFIFSVILFLPLYFFIIANFSGVFCLQSSFLSQYNLYRSLLLSLYLTLEEVVQENCLKVLISVSVVVICERSDSDVG